MEAGNVINNDLHVTVGLFHGGDNDSSLLPTATRGKLNPGLMTFRQL